MRLKQLMAETGVTQQQVADALGITAPAMNHYINGRREPSIEMLCKLADFFGVTVDYLIGRDVKTETPVVDKAFVRAGGRTVELDPSQPVLFQVGDKTFELVLAEEKVK